MTEHLDTNFCVSDCDLKELRDSPEELKKQEEEETLKHLPTKSVRHVEARTSTAVILVVEMPSNS